MPLRELIEPSITALTAQLASNKLLLLHPSAHYRVPIIGALLENPPCPIFYYSFDSGEVNFEQFLSELVRDLTDQASTFGRRLNEAINKSPRDAARLAKAFGKDLAELSKEDFLLIIDNYDCADDSSEIQSFFEQVLESLPEQCHLLINGRSLPRLPWVALVARNQAVVLRDGELLPSSFYGEANTQSPTLEVYALGPGHVLINGQHITSWEGHLPRLLFFFTLDRPMCTRADICQAFWPELSTAQAVNVFHVTKRRLHKALGYDVVTHDGNHYQANPDLNIRYDVMEFVSSLVAARSKEGAAAEPLWQHAIDMYRGHYLHGHDDPWIVTRRADFIEGYLEALTALARIREAQGKPESALGLLQRALNDANNREDLHREVLQLYGKLGRRAEAADHYQKLEQEFREKYSIEPSPETKEAYREAVSG